VCLARRGLPARQTQSRRLTMNEVSKIEIPVEPATAAALSDARRREAVGRLVDRLVRPGADDPLIALFERTAAEARQIGLTQAEIEAELAAYNAERRG
jgi:hypothetical protein